MFVNFDAIHVSTDPPVWYGHRVYDATYIVTTHPPRTSSRACEGSPPYSGDPSQARDDVREGSEQLPYLLQSTKERRHLFYKENKQQYKPINSNFEVAFSGLAKLFLSPGLTSDHYVVQKGNEVSGVASEDIVYTIFQNLNQGEKIFYSLDCSKRLQFQAQVVKRAEDIPVYFFNQIPSGFLSKLHQLKKDGFLLINMESLASVLTTAYTLEEDDLHKGNFGFYLIENHGKIEIVFVKIDHDLMLSDSIMSRGSARFANLLYADRAFAVSSRDLLRFPILTDSGNHYWPTRTGFWIKHTSRQVYTWSERRTIAALSQDEAFQQAKWRSFFKSILLQYAEIEQAVSVGFDVQTPEGQAYIALVANAVVARQARLRAVLFSLPEFRHFVATINPDIEEKLIHEIVPERDAVSHSRQEILRQSITDYKNMCQSECFASGDTPLHSAIRLGHYRYDESWHDYGRYANSLNAQGQTPLDVAVEQFTHQQSQGTVTADDNQNPVFIIQDLIQRGARKTTAFKAIQSQLDSAATGHWGESYREKARLAYNHEMMLNIFRELGTDCRLTLKMKKELAVQCFKEHITTAKARRDYSLEGRLQELKLALNGNLVLKPDPALQFIRQLRSRLWIVRQIRGLFGGSSTQVLLNKLLDTELHRFSSVNYGASFFNMGSKSSLANEDNDPLKVARMDGELDAKPCDHTGGFF